MKRLARLITLIFVAIGLGLLTTVPPLLEIELALQDMVHGQAYPRGAPSKDVSVVVFTEADMDELALPYLSPIDRGVIADIILHAAEGRPAAIGLDILIDRPSELEKDERLRQALAATDTVIAAAGGADGLGPERLNFLQSFADSATLGHATLVKSGATGAVRGAPGLRETIEDGTPAFAAALAAKAGVDRRGQDLTLAYSPKVAGEVNRFPTYSVSEMLVLPPRWFADRVVLIGADLGANSRHRVPMRDLGVTTPTTEAGVVFQAQLVQQILDARRLIVAPRYAAAFLAVAAAALGWWLVGVKAPQALRWLGFLGAIALLFAVPAVLLATAGIRAPVLGSLFGILVAAGLRSGLLWLLAIRQRRRLINGFEKYLAPELVSRLVRDPSGLQLGGERREVTLFFSDVEGFTKFSETAAPETLCRLLNAYLDEVSRIIIAHGGTLDKFVGDAVVALFGAPTWRDDHAAAAVRAALAVDTFCARFAVDAARDGHGFGRTRIGLHMGDATVGNFGGERFFDYTAIGDVVNLAARLEGANKTLGTRICVSKTVAEAAMAMDDSLAMRAIDSITVRGRMQPVEVFEPLWRSSHDPDDLAAFQAATRKAAVDPTAALALMKALKATGRDDPLVLRWIEKLEKADG